MKINRLSKKAISVVLALALVLSCITVSLSVFATVKPFHVTEGSPAVPIYVGREITLSNLTIDIGGTQKSGDTLNWGSPSGAAAKVEGGKLIGVSAGKSRFTVSDGVNTQNVWVLVNAQGDTDFYLVNIDFNDTKTYSQSDWLGTASAAYNAGKTYISGDTFKYNPSSVAFKKVTTSAGVQRTAMYVGSIGDKSGTKGVIFKNDMLKDFGDYTIDTEMSHVSSKSTTLYNSVIAAAGIMARTSIVSSPSSGSVILDPDVKSLHLRMRNYGGLTITGYNGTNSNSGSQDYLSQDQGFSFYNGNVTADDLWINGDSSKIFYPDIFGTTEPTIRNISVSLNGSDIKYAIDGNVILNSENGKIGSMFAAFNDSTPPDSTKPSATENKAMLDQAYSGKYISGNTLTAEQFDALYKQNIQAAKGTIGFTMNYGGDIYVFSVKVKPNNFDENTMPFMDGDEEPVALDIPVNTRYDLSKEEQGVVWDNVRTEDYEVVNSTLSVFGMPKRETITVTGTKNGGSVARTFTVLERGESTELPVTEIAKEHLSVYPILNKDNTYKVVVDTEDDMEVKHGTLILNDGDDTSKVFNSVTDSRKGNEFEFTVFNPANFSIDAAYTTREENIASIYDLASTIRLASSAKGAGIRFLTRVPAIFFDAQGAIELENTISVNGEDVTPVEIGTLLIPEVVLNGSELKFPDNYQSGQFYINDCKVRQNVITSLSKATDRYADAYTTVGDFTNEGFDSIDPLKVAITERAYIKYQDGDGKFGYVYANSNSSSYNEILTKAFPLKETDYKLTAGLDAGTNHSLDTDSATTDLSYEVGENISFTYNIAGGYRLNWKLCKDDPTNNLFDAESYDGNAENCVLSGTTQQGENVFTVTTQMKRAGTVKLVATLCDSYGDPVNYADGPAVLNTVVAANAEDIKQPLENAGLKPSDNSDLLGTMAITFADRASFVNNTINTSRDDVKTFLTSATAGQSKTFGGVLKLTCSSANTNFRYFDFVIAVDDTVGLTTTGSNGLFSDTVYSTAATKTGSKAYNLRPATGCFAVPKTATSMTSIVANYKDNDDQPGTYSGGTNNTIVVNMNSHGYDNAKAVANASYISTLAGSFAANGGIKDCLTSSAEAALTKAVDSYAYGIIYRDYLALQVAKDLFKIVMDKGASNITTQGYGMGGWQSLMVSALDPVLTATKADDPWLASLGNSSKDLDGKVQPNGKALRYYSSATAAQRIATNMSARPKNYTVTLTGEMADTVSPANGVISIYAALKDANCNKQITMRQFSDHGTAPIENAKLYNNVLKGTYNTAEGRAAIDTSGIEDPVTPGGDIPVGGTSPTRSTIVAGGDSLPSSLRTDFKVPTNLMTTEQYHTKIDTLRTSADSSKSIQTASSTMLSNIDNLDLMLQDSIVYNTDDLVNHSGYTKKYYVSSSTGNDNNSGTSPEKAWKTIKKVNTSSIASGSLVSFKRGDTFRGILDPKSGVDYGAYGIGYKPILMASYSTQENGWKWVATGKTNIWKLDHKFTADNSSNYGCSFSSDLTHDMSLATLIDKDGNQYAVSKEKWICNLNNKGDLDSKGRVHSHIKYEYCYTGTEYNYSKIDMDDGFAHTGDNEMYLYCEGDPNELFVNAEIGMWSSCINENNNYRHDIRVNNLEMLYGTGSFWPGACNNIKMDYCISGWQGGFLAPKNGFDGRPYTGGVGDSVACDSLIFDHCYIFQQWDSGVSIQTKTANRDPYGGNGDTVFKDFITTNCLLKGTKWTLEAWLHVPNTTTDVIDHMVFDYNIVRDTGWGFNFFEPEDSGIVETWGYGNQYENGCSISHNIFDRPYQRFYRIGGFNQHEDNTYTFGAEYFPTVDYNILLQSSGKQFAIIKRMCDKSYTSDHTLSYNDQGMLSIRNSYGLDKHSLFLYANR